MKPVILLAFANYKEGAGAGYLQWLTAERNGIRDALQDAVQAGLCEVLIEPDATIARLFDIFQQHAYQDRIAVFHYAGHAESYQLLLETASGTVQAAHSTGLVSFLARQKGLQLVFLNGCSSRKQSEDLVRAGLPAVIGTSRPIDDAIATGLSVRFYKGLAEGNSIERAWQESMDQMKTERGTEQLRSLFEEEPADQSGVFPWELLLGESGASAGAWNLRDAARQPLFGLELPPAYFRRLPDVPFPGLAPFQDEDAAVFFGRGHQIRALYNQLLGLQPVILFSGAVGTGKTSLLQAGLMPRIAFRFCCAYASCGKLPLQDALNAALSQAAARLGLPDSGPETGGLLEPRMEELRKSLDVSTGFAREVLEKELEKLSRLESRAPGLPARWRMIEQAAQKPLVLILDGVQADGADWPGLMNVLHSLFDEAAQPPVRGRLILSCRDTHHDAVEAALRTASVPYAELFLPPLDREGMIEACTGAAALPAAAGLYQLDVDEGLPVALADDLLEGGTALAAPLLQVILQQLWHAAGPDHQHRRRLTLHLYQERKISGDMMDRLFRRQLADLAQTHPAHVQSGLLLDLLYRHTTALGTGAALDQTLQQELYGSRSAATGELTARCLDLYLLSASPGGTGLGHDLLAPVIIRQYSQSVCPGQQAARILNSKMGDAAEAGSENWLDEADLDVVEAGLPGMREPDAQELRLLQVSRARKLRLQRERRRSLRVRQTLAAVVLLFAVLAGWQWQVSQRNYRHALANQLAFTARELLPSDNTVALRIAYEAYAMLGSRSSATVTQALSEIFHTQETRPVYTARYAHAENVNTAVFSPDGQQVLTASEDGFAKLWDLQGQEIQAFPHGIEVREAAFSPNGQQILTLTADHVRLWDLGGGLAGQDSVPEGAVLAQYSTDGARIIPAPQGMEQLSCVLPLDSAELLEVRFSACAPDGSRFAVSANPEGGETSRITVRDRNGQLLCAFSCPGREVRAAFSPDGRQLLTASSDKTARRWDLGALQFFRLPAHRSAVNTAVFSPDGRWLLTASHDSLARLWEWPGILRDSLRHGAEVLSAAFAPGGVSIVTVAGDSSARLWTPGRQALRLPHRDQVRSAVFSPDGSLLLTAAADSLARIWTAAGVLADSVRYGGEVLGASFSPDGKRMLSAVSDSSVQIHSLEGQLISRFAHPDQVYAARFSPDGSQVLSTCRDRNTRLWAASGALIRQFPHRMNVRLAWFSPDGRLILTGGSLVKLWDRQGRALDSLRHGQPVTSLTFSPDGKQILTASADSRARLWSLEGTLLAEYAAHSQKVNTAAFSPDGRYLLSAADDGFAVRWHTPQAIYEALGSAPLYRLTRQEQEQYEVPR